MKRWLAGLLALALLLPTQPAQSQVVTPTPGICSDTPLAALPPARPVWCDEPLATGPATFIDYGGRWRDEFNHGLQRATLGDGYVSGTIGGGRSLHFRHLDHWMSDIHSQSGRFPTQIATWMRPDRAFVLEPGRTLTITFEVAVPIAGTRNIDTLSDSWPEIVLSTASAPTTNNPWGSPWRPNGTYLYEAYPYHWTFGCRLQQSRHPICAIYQPNVGGNPAYAGGPDRLWEINQNGTDVRFEQGGNPASVSRPDVWRQCASADDPDTVCRNVFTLRLTTTELELDVNGFLWYRAGLIDGNLSNILHNPQGFYVFFGGFAYRIARDEVLRFHWDQLDVITGAATAPGLTPTPTATPTPPTVTATPTPSATAMATVAPLCDVVMFKRGAVNYREPAGCVLEN